jgi:hypothetical protein
MVFLLNLNKVMSPCGALSAFTGYAVRSRNPYRRPFPKGAELAALLSERDKR